MLSRMSESVSKSVSQFVQHRLSDSLVSHKVEVFAC